MLRSHICYYKHNPRFVFDTVFKLTQYRPSVSCRSFTAHDLFLQKRDDKKTKLVPQIQLQKNSAIWCSYVESQIISVLTNVGFLTNQSPYQLNILNVFGHFDDLQCLIFLISTLTTKIVPTNFKTAVFLNLYLSNHTLTQGLLIIIDQSATLPFFSKPLKRVLSLSLSTPFI